MNINELMGKNVARAIDLGAIVKHLGAAEKTCELHGPYQARGRYIAPLKRESWSECPRCVKEQEEAARAAAKEHAAQERQLALEMRLGQAAIPPRFRNRTLDSFIASTKEQQSAQRVARDYLENFDEYAAEGRGLVLAGPPGTGKSHIATSILSAALERHSGCYVTCSDFIRAVRSTWHRESEKTEAQVLGEYAGVTLLVLDEIGVAFGSEGEQKHLFDLLDRRYRDLLPTIILTNEDASGLRRFVGERVFDRLTENSEWISCSWASYRSKAGKEVQQ